MTISPSPPQPPTYPQRGVTARAVVMGLVLLPLNAFWLVEMEMGATGSARSAGPFPTTFSLFANVVVWLTLLAALNAVLRRVAP